MLNSRRPADRTSCPRGALLGLAERGTYVVPARCKRWDCDRCGPINARRLAHRIERFPVRRFLTLTVRPSPVDAPQDQLDEMHLAWRALWKQIQRRSNGRARAYVRVVEVTKVGTPHLHIALDSPSIPQAWLADRWRELTGSYIVDIRAVHSKRGFAHYLAKYVTKAAGHVAGRRKWSCTAHALPPPPSYQHPDCRDVTSWTWTIAAAEDVLHAYLYAGYAIDGCRAEPPEQGRSPPRAPATGAQSPLLASASCSPPPAHPSPSQGSPRSAPPA